MRGEKRRGENDGGRRKEIKGRRERKQEERERGKRRRGGRELREVRDGIEMGTEAISSGAIKSPKKHV